MSLTEPANSPEQIVPGTIEPGHTDPLGASIEPRGVNFSVYSRDASKIEILLFDREDDARPAQVISLDPFLNRT